MNGSIGRGADILMDQGNRMRSNAPGNGGLVDVGAVVGGMDASGVSGFVS